MMKKLTVGTQTRISFFSTNFLQKRFRPDKYLARCAMNWSRNTCYPHVAPGYCRTSLTKTEMCDQLLMKYPESDYIASFMGFSDVASEKKDRAKAASTFTIFLCNRARKISDR